MASLFLSQRARSHPHSLLRSGWQRLKVLGKSLLEGISGAIK
ncbi:hypothetical protein [Planktothricoides raciborskii]|nr:hypothetical protein [Planktothricoides raciborskii]